MRRLLPLIAFLITLPYILSAQVENYSAGLEGQKLDWLLYYLDENYVDSLDNGEMAEVAIRAIVEKLDPYSVYQTKEEVEEQMNADKGYSGVAVGFSYYFLRDTAIVTYVHSDGPAQIAGLKRGDQIIQMDGEKITNQAGRKKLEIVINEKSINSISLDVIRYRTTPKKINIEKGLVPWRSVNAAYMITNSIGYIKLGKFTLKTMEEFLPALNLLKSKGMQELILDMRNNAGGVKDQALSLADEFLSEGKVVYSTGGHNIKKEQYISKSGGAWERGKVTILQDAYTASASEIFIAALQEWDRAVVMGVSTYGKGLIQQSYKLGDGSNIRLTIGRYFTPTGRHLQRSGNNENDWMTPYKDILYSNSLTSKLDVPNSLKMKTMGGRSILAGRGGIIPDIYYVYKDDSDWSLYNRLNNLGLLYEFATDYVHRNRQEIYSEYETTSALVEDRIREAFMLKEFREFLISREQGLILPSNFPNNIIWQLKTWMASQLWHDNAYYEVENGDDRLVFRAMEVSRGKVHDNLGVGY